MCTAETNQASSIGSTGVGVPVLRTGNNRERAVFGLRSLAFALKSERSLCVHLLLLSGRRDNIGDSQLPEKALAFALRLHCVRAR